MQQRGKNFLFANFIYNHFFQILSNSRCCFIRTFFFFFSGSVVTPTVPLAVVTAGALVAGETVAAVAAWRDVENCMRITEK